jgi:hypothetical protein
MKPLNRLLTAAAATVAIVGAAGCGSDDTTVGDPSDAAPQITGEDAIAEISFDLQLELVPGGPQPDGSIAVNAILDAPNGTVRWPRVDLAVPAGTTVTAGTLTPRPVTSETGIGRCAGITLWECYTDVFTVSSVPLTMELFVTPPAGTDGPIEITGTALFDIGIEYNERNWSLRTDPYPANNTVTITLE